mgnify:FL=1
MKLTITLLLIFITQSMYSQIPPLRTIMEVEGTLNSDMMLGTGMLGLGDINNDGYPDFAVGAKNIGKTLIYFGGPGILDSTPDVTIKGGGGTMQGDINGDGYNDLVISYGDTFLVYKGKVPFQLAIDTIPFISFKGENVTDHYGASSAIGDLNNDGFDDVVVGAFTYGPDQGKVYIYLGKAIPNGIPDFTGVGDTVSSRYGIYIKIADINGDGIFDLAISSKDSRGFATLDIFYGHSGWTFSRDSYNQRLDSRIIGIEKLYWFNLVDVNTDDKADISITNFFNEYFFYGTSDTIKYQPSLILQNPDTTLFLAFYGPAIDIGDINNDGKSDFAVRASPGGPAMCVLVYLGGQNPSTKHVAARCKGFVEVSDSFTNIVPVGDINGDGLKDFGGTVPRDALGSPPQDGYFALYSGDSTWVTTVPSDVLYPTTLTLSQNYPNPFNPETRIDYTLPRSGKVTIVIYDMLGKEVRILVNNYQTTGNHETIWNGKTDFGSLAPSGVYFYKLSVDDIFYETKKLVLLK